MDPSQTEPYTPPPPSAPPVAAAGPTSPPASSGGGWGSTGPGGSSWGAGGAGATARRGASSRNADLVFGAILVLVGLWLFADITLALELPRVRWGELWPLAIIGLGGWILLGSFRRR